MLDRPKLAITPRMAVLTLVGLSVLLVISYFLWRLIPIFRSPELVLETPRDRTVTSVREVALRGRVEKDSKLIINKEEIYVDGEGRFDRTAYLDLGQNTFDITAKGKFGREADRTIYITYRPEQNGGK
jgi:hypothetical protein